MKPGPVLAHFITNILCGIDPVVASMSCITRFEPYAREKEFERYHQTNGDRVHSSTLTHIINALGYAGYGIVSLHPEKSMVMVQGGPVPHGHRRRLSVTFQMDTILVKCEPFVLGEGPVMAPRNDHVIQLYKIPKLSVSKPVPGNSLPLICGGSMGPLTVRGAKGEAATPTGVRLKPRRHSIC